MTLFKFFAVANETVLPSAEVTFTVPADTVADSPTEGSVAVGAGVTAGSSDGFESDGVGVVSSGCNLSILSTVFVCV